MEFWDDYEHNDPHLTYILENIKTDEIERSINDEFAGCGCEGKCTPAKCSCLKRSGVKYSFSNRSMLDEYVFDITDKSKPVYECNNNCNCREKVCGNKLVQFGPRKNLKIVNTDALRNSDSDQNKIDINAKGLGLLTLDEIKSGNFICEYAGEVLTSSETQRRFKTYAEMQLRNNYIFCINENFGETNQKTFIDPTFYGNVGRYINHSCQPNCILVPVRVHDAIPKLCIFAKESISKNTEITFDYGENDICDGNKSKKPCLCLSSNCRGYLPFDGTI